MSKVVDHLAELTGFRDRDVLDTTLAGALRDLLEPLRVAIYRRADKDADGRRWLTRARLTADEAAATADPLWVEFDSLPRLTDFPARLAAIDSHEMVAVPASPTSACSRCSRIAMSPGWSKSKRHSHWMPSSSGWWRASCAYTPTFRACSTYSER